MHRLVASFFAVLLIAAACGDDDSGGAAQPTTAAPPTTAVPATTVGPTTTTAAPTTSAAPTTTLAPTTTTPAPTTTQAAVDPNLAIRIAGARLLAGEWSGTWENTTFGSTGPIEVTVAVDADAGLLVADIDVGGSVFGLEDPEPGVFELGLVTGPPYAMQSALLGEFTVDIGNDGSFTLVADEVAAEGIASMTIDGSLNTQAFAATYTIEFDGGGGAEGTIDVVKQ